MSAADPNKARKPLDPQARKRAARRRQREEALRLERAVALANPALVRTPPAVVSVAEFRKLTGLSPATIARRLKDGTLKSTKLNRRRLIAYSEIARMRGEQA